MDKESPLYSMMMRERVMDKAQDAVADGAEPVAWMRNPGGWTPLYTHPAAAAGKVLVPAEPTEAMVDAGNRYNFSASTHLTAKGIYKAMLAAAKEDSK